MALSHNLVIGRFQWFFATIREKKGFEELRKISVTSYQFKFIKTVFLQDKCNFDLRKHPTYEAKVLHLQY